jgi:DNA primase
VSDKTLQQIHDLEFDNVLIWLDPDKAGREGAFKTLKKLNHYLPTTTHLSIFTFDKEPKECTPEELNKLLKGF